MSEKATGNDWKKSSILTLRHAAGCQKYLTIKTNTRNRRNNGNNTTELITPIVVPNIIVPNIIRPDIIVPNIIVPNIIVHMTTTTTTPTTIIQPHKQATIVIPK